MKWTVSYSPEEALQGISALGDRATGSGAQAVAARIASKLHEASRRSFVAKAEPIHGAAWAPPSELTKNERDSRRRRGFVSLLDRLGILKDEIVSGFGKTDVGAIAFLNIDSKRRHPYSNANLYGLAMIHLYGVQAKARRTYIRQTRRGPKKESRRRLHPTQQMPARGFVGLPPSEIADLAEYAEKVMVP